MNLVNTLTGVRGNRDSTRSAPSTLEPFERCDIVDARNRRPLFQCFRDPVECNSDVSSLISILRRSRRPADISRFVVTISFFAIERVLFSRSSANGLQKLIERRKPKFYATTSIVSVRRFVWVLAARFSAVISKIFRRGFAASGFAMFQNFFLSLLVSEASARGTHAASKRDAQNGFGLATVAATAPQSRPAAIVTVIALHEPTIETLAFHIYEVGLMNLSEIHKGIISQIASVYKAREVDCAV